MATIGQFMPTPMCTLKYTHTHTHMLSQRSLSVLIGLAGVSPGYGVKRSEATTLLSEGTCLCVL